MVKDTLTDPDKADLRGHRTTENRTANHHRIHSRADQGTILSGKDNRDNLQHPGDRTQTALGMSHRTQQTGGLYVVSVI